MGEVSLSSIMKGAYFPYFHSSSPVVPINVSLISYVCGIHETSIWDHRIMDE